MTTTTTALIRVATYERVSSEDQRERETIKTQADELARRLESDPTAELVARFIDDGVSGTIPMAERPQGRRLFQAAQAREFDELWIYNIKRLGREAVDLLLLRRKLEPLGIRLMSLLEGEQTGLGYDVQAVVADYDRRLLLRVFADGMNRAAREGRYTGGIVPMGYMVEGRKPAARLVPNDNIIWGDWSEADLIRKIYHWMAMEGWTCPRVTRHLNALGVPTAYARDQRLVRRGQRKERTQECWRPGRLLSMVRNPIYRGEQQYGRRSTKPGGREVISASVPALVTPELWEAVQQTLDRNRIMPKNTHRIYLLRSVIRCGGCGKTYVSCWGRGFVWYRCNGRLIDRSPIDQRCQAKTVRGTDLEQLVWADIERFLRDPGDILEELSRERELDSAAAVLEAERAGLENALVGLQQRRKKAIDLHLRETISEGELDELLAQLGAEKTGIEQRLREIQPDLTVADEPLGEDLLQELRRRLDQELTDTQRQEVVQHLVKQITIHTEGERIRALIEYRFPAVVNDRRGMDSAPRPA
ncbi:MAG: recombinase family protein [Chloroflexi bacterium]|nr:recombinase family protein [Chloroflexota bacterium]MDA1220101.1 recombinase family protein [Chloroflexota bacterium]